MKRLLIIFATALLGCYEGENIGIIRIEGIILEYEDKVKEIRYFMEKRPEIRALVIYINSPGGSASASYQIFSALKDFKKKTGKKVYAYIGAIGASGGYYIACSADKIMADPNSLTGSIGVRVSFLYYYELLKKLGIYEKTIKSGKYKDIGSPFREMEKEEEKIIEEFVQDIYIQFLDVVSSERKISRKDLEKIADGRIFSGRRAKEIGLVDTTGSFENFKDILKKELNLKKINFIKAPVKKSLWAKIFELKEKLSFPQIKVEYRFP